MSAAARFRLLLSLFWLLTMLPATAAPGPAVRQEGGLWLLENRSLRVTVDPRSGRIAVLDRRCRRQWRQPERTREPFRSVRRLPDGIAFDADFGNTRGHPNTITVNLRIPEDAADLIVTADMADRAEPCDSFFFLEPFTLETPDGVLAVADYCDGHLYPLAAEPFPRTWFDGGRLDLPFVGVCDLTKGFGYALILETSDDAFVQCQPYTVAGSRFYAPQVGWSASKGMFRYPRRLLYRFASAGGYVALAKSYRAYAQANGLVVPFTQKLKRNPNIRRLFGAPDVWGDATLAFARQAKAAGVEKMLIHGRSTPEEMKAIGAMGYLPSEYDNYTDILPLEAGKSPDSNHDRLPEAAVLNADGKRMTAWLTYDKKTQYMKRCPALWVAAARQVIPALLKTYPYLGRFIDVTTAEGLYECYDPNHPLVKAEKRAAGQNLLAFVRANGLVVGGEHGIWWGAPHQDYIEGMMSGNRFAWPAGHLIHPKNKQEKFSGPYGAETWEVYDRWSLGHEWRAPLWELVFHDCVAATWYWGDSNDYLLDAAPETMAKKDAFNVLYGTMPMLWADSDGAWHKDRAGFLRTYRNVCRLHETVAEAEMLSHEFLTSDHALQRTRFSNGTVCVVNFGEKPLPVTLAGKTYLLPQNGWAVQGPQFEQSRALADGVVVTRIAEPGYVSREVKGRVVTARTVGPARIRVQFAASEQTAEVQPGLVQAGWDLATTHAFVLDAEGARVRQIPLTHAGNSLRLAVGGAESIELICGTAAHLPDLQIEARDLTLSPAGPLHQGMAATAVVRVHNMGGASASMTRVALYADAERPENLLGATTVSIAPGASRTVRFRVDTTAIDGNRHLAASAALTQRELCDRNNSASLALNVLPDFARWPQKRPLQVEAGEVDREEATAEFRLSDPALDPASIRVAACDDLGRPLTFVPAQLHRVSAGQWTLLFTVPGHLPAGQSRRFALLSAPLGGTRFLLPGGSLWDGAHLTFRGTTYEAHFENGTLHGIGAPGHAAISHLMFSSQATGWTEEPGTVQRFTVLEDGPVRTVVAVRKALNAGVVTDKTFTFYRDRFEVAGVVSGGEGVFSRAYYLLPGQYEDSGGFRAVVDGQGDAEGVSNRAQRPRWYTVTGEGWGHSCVALSPVNDITYWDASGSWGGIGFDASPLQDLRFCYVFHSGPLRASYGALDMQRLTLPIRVTAE
jgi:hypothetical protein